MKNIEIPVVRKMTNPRKTKKKKWKYSECNTSIRSLIRRKSDEVYFILRDFNTEMIAEFQNERLDTS